jgi:hypothetical protein
MDKRLTKWNFRRLLSFIMVFLLFGLISCYRQITCPEFNEEILNWVPYQKNDVIELYSPAIESTLKFSINSVGVIHTTGVEII